MTKKELNNTVSRLVNKVVLKITEGKGDAYEPTAADEDKARTLVDMALIASEDKLMASIPVVNSI
ncbi:MAG: hypothetical protein WC919_06985 [Candidatus Paceibacterota bacterium]|jgi:hypothetical protein